MRKDHLAVRRLDQGRRLAGAEVSVRGAIPAPVLPQAGQSQEAFVLLYVRRFAPPAQTAGKKLGLPSDARYYKGIFTIYRQTLQKDTVGMQAVKMQRWKCPAAWP